MCIWVRSRNCGCLVTWFWYQLIAKPGNKTAADSRPDPYIAIIFHASISYFCRQVWGIIRHTWSNLLTSIAGSIVVVELAIVFEHTVDWVAHICRVLVRAHTGTHTMPVGCKYSETPHEQPPHEQPPLLWGHIFRHHYIFLTSHLNVNPWWTATPLTWSEASDFGSSHPWRAATQQLLEVASHGIHGWFGCGLTDIHVNHTSGQPWVHRPKACKGVDHT